MLLPLLLLLVGVSYRNNIRFALLITHSCFHQTHDDNDGAPFISLELFPDGNRAALEVKIERVFQKTNKQNYYSSPCLSWLSLNPKDKTTDVQCSTDWSSVCLNVWEDDTKRITFNISPSCPLFLTLCRNTIIYILPALPPRID